MWRKIVEKGQCITCSRYVQCLALIFLTQEDFSVPQLTHFLSLAPIIDNLYIGIIIEKNLEKEGKDTSRNHSVYQMEGDRFGQRESDADRRTVPGICPWEICPASRLWPFPPLTSGQQVESPAPPHHLSASQFPCSQSVGGFSTQATPFPETAQWTAWRA